MTHTQGPWHYQKGFDCYYVKKDKDSSTAFCEVTNSSWEQCEANARLIAAAPEILQCLKDNHSILFMLREIEPSVERKAILADQLTLNSILIAKAEGK